MLLIGKTYPMRTSGISYMGQKTEQITISEEYPDYWLGHMTSFMGASIRVKVYKSTYQVFDTMSNLFWGHLDAPEYNKPIEPKNECECGGWKTYKSMEPHYHSHWCPVNSKPKKDGYLYVK